LEKERRTLLYLMMAGGIRKRDCFMKIGITKEGVEKRIAKLQTGCPWKIQPLVAIDLKSEISLKREKELHGYLIKFKSKGEWFVMTDESVSIVTDFFVALMMEDEMASIHRKIGNHVTRPKMKPDGHDYVNDPPIKINNLTGRPQKYQNTKPIFNLFQVITRHNNSHLGDIHDYINLT
jgi:hypothetical protein